MDIWHKTSHESVVDNLVFVGRCRWSQFRDLVDQKKDSLNSALGVQNYHLECNETKSWIKEKTKVLNKTAPQTKHVTVAQMQQRKRLNKRDKFCFLCVSFVFLLAIVSWNYSLYIFSFLLKQ